MFVYPNTIKTFINEKKNLASLVLAVLLVVVPIGNSLGYKEIID